MPNYYRFEQQFFDYLSNLERNIKSSPVYLGVGSGGGATIIGTLPQTRVSYDSNELADNTTSSVPTLVDNLNHIRYDVQTLQEVCISGAEGLTKGHNIFDETVELTQRDKLRFLGSSITVVDNESENASDVTIEPVLSFPELTDTPSGTYVTESGKYIRVTSDGSELEFASAPIWGDKIVLIYADGSVSDQYDATETGLKAALADASDGDTVLLPPKTIVITDDGLDDGSGSLVITDGVTLRGTDKDKSLIYANITFTSEVSHALIWMEGQSSLENLSINYYRENCIGALYAVKSETYPVADYGDVRIHDVNVRVENTEVGGGANGVWVCGIASTDSAIVMANDCTFQVFGTYGVAARFSIEADGTTKSSIFRNIIASVDTTGYEKTSGTLSTYGLYIKAITSPWEGRVLIEGCHGEAINTNPLTSSYYGSTYGINTWYVGSIELRDSTGIASSVSSHYQTITYGIYVSALSDTAIRSKILNCIGIASSASELRDLGGWQDAYYNYGPYNTAGLFTVASDIFGGYYEGENSVGNSFGINAFYNDQEIHNASFSGGTSDILLHQLDYVSVYSCQFSTWSSYGDFKGDHEGGLEEILYLGGDRGTYIVEEKHSDDIYDDTLTRHLPLPTISGYIPISNGSTWVLDSGEGYVTSFLRLNDTPPSYTGQVGKALVVNDSEDGLDYATMSGAGTGSGSGLNDKVKVSSNDIQESYLLSKLVAGSGIIVSELDDSSFETLEISMQGGSGDGANKIIRMDSGGEYLEQYDVTEAGLTSALADSSSGDIVEIPPQTLTWTTDGTTSDPDGRITIPEGVVLRGKDRERSIISATVPYTGSSRVLIYVTNGCHIENLTIDYNPTGGGSAYVIFYNYGDVYNHGMTMKDVTVLGESITGDIEVIVQLPRFSDRDTIGIDNCSINLKTYSDAETFIYTYGDGLYDTSIIIKDSSFYTINNNEASVYRSYLSGLDLGVGGDGKVLIDNCFAYAELKVATTDRSYTEGITGWGAMEIRDSTGIAKSAGTDAETATHGISVWMNSYQYYPDDDALHRETILIRNCLGIAHSESTSTGSYTTVGLECEEAFVLGGFYRATCGGTSNQVYGARIYADYYDVHLKNATFQGDTYDLEASNDYSTFNLYGCQFDTLLESAQPVNIGKGDRASYYVEDYHAEDIEDDDLTRHLPLPTISGYVAVSTGEKWILDAVSGAGGGGEPGAVSFLELTDTPSDYAGHLGKVLVVASGEANLEFTDAGTGDMVKSVYDTNDDGIVNEADTVAWDGVTGKPSTYPPETHIHDDRYYREAEIDAKWTEHDEFLDDDDTPSSYAGQALKAVIVAETEDQLAFANIAGIGSGAFKVMASDNDTTPNYLINKFVAGSGIIISEVNNGGDESIRIDTTASGVSDMLKSVYDTNDDGIVNEADVVTWSGVSGKPSTYPPDSHDHDDLYYTETEVDTKLALQDEFLELTDTPSSYAGHVGKSVVVAAGENSLEFVTVSGSGSDNTEPLFLARW